MNDMSSKIFAEERHVKRSELAEIFKKLGIPITKYQLDKRAVDVPYHEWSKRTITYYLPEVKDWLDSKRVKVVYDEEDE